MMLEKMSNLEIQKQFAKDKAQGKGAVWQRRSHRIHLENLRRLHEEARGDHYGRHKKM